MIPKVIHYCWLSGDPFPEMVEKCINSWKEKLPDYELVLWDVGRLVKEFHLEKNSTNNIEFHESGGQLWLKQTIQNRKYAFAADYLRVYALYHYGGIYLDSDVEVTGSFDPFLGNDLFMGFDYQNDLEAAIIGAVPGHLWMKELCEYYSKRSFIKKDGSLDIKPLPTIFDKIAKQLFKYEKDGKLQFIKDHRISIYPNDYFSPKNIYFNKVKKTGNTVAIHHLKGGWIKRGMSFHLKRLVHQFLYVVGGRQLHDQMIRLIR